jgi:hypothetical protein
MGGGGHQANREGCNCKTQDAFHIVLIGGIFYLRVCRSGDPHPVWLHHRIVRMGAQCTEGESSGELMVNCGTVGQHGS